MAAALGLAGSGAAQHLWYRSGGVTLLPGTGGVFEIACGGEVLWERKRDGGFPDARTLKNRVRDLVFPERDLGHSEGQRREGGDGAPEGA